MIFKLPIIYRGGSKIIRRIRVMSDAVYPLLFSFLIIFYFASIADSTVIWQIGENNYECSEFNSSDEKVIDYQVPLDWESRLGQNGQGWGKFPSCLYLYHDESNYPQEIWINYYYPKDYSNPVLKIFAAASQHFASQYLEVYKGPEAKEETFIDKKMVGLPRYIACDFTLGKIKMGLHDENRIILRNISGDTRSDTLHIFFDALYLDDNDSDGDWITDPDEGDEDWDLDGVPDKFDKDTVCIPIESDDPNIIKRICMDIRESEGEIPSFHEVKFLDPNSLNLPGWLKYDRYLPYGILGFKIEDIKSNEEIHLRISYKDELYSSVRFYAYHDSNDWQELAFEYLDNKTVNIILKDGEAGDMDKESYGSINTVLALSYPSSLNIEIEKDGCFLESVFR